MGANESKPSGPHSWKASGPSSVSQEIVDSLQTTNETDASRSRLVELQIQSRVAEELKKLQQKESEALALVHEKLSSLPDEKEGTNSRAVNKQVEDLRQKLEQRKQLRDLPDGVDAARNEVVRCLRENDRRPLDCWEEVETFKREVKKMELQWVDKVVS